MKFRIWDKNRNQMIENIRITQNKNNKIIEILNDKNEFEEIKKDDYFIMESIDLYDVNGKEIFENDVVEHTDGEYSFVGVVQKSPFGTYVYSKQQDDYYSFEDFADENNKTADCRVITHIFE